MTAGGVPETRSLVVVSAGQSDPSSTRMLAERLRVATTARLEADGVAVTTTWVDLKDVAADVMSMLLTGFGEPELEAALAALESADGAIFVTPIFTTSYSGLFKSFVDLIQPGALTDLAVAIGATGGSERHSLALDHSIRPLFLYHHAVVVPTAVYAATADWGADTRTTGLPDRIERAAGELAALLRTSTRSSRVIDPFALPTGFDPAGARRTS